jgi:hypothetical protein
VVRRFGQELRERGVDLAPAPSTRRMKAGGGHNGEPLEATQEEVVVRFMVFVKANKDSEAGIMPDPKILTDMGHYNEALADAGVIQAAEGLRPSSFGKRVRFDGAQRTVIDGPFAETKELIAGFWIFKTKSMEAALEWVKRAPFGGGVELEVRPIFETEDFAAQFPELTPELQKREERLRSRMKS